jgi:glycosyltransferase involved in cell wall biosynthesis
MPDPTDPVHAARPSVVVVIPFYNGAAFIERALKSVFNQSVPADEVVVVNDGSLPEERAALGALAGRYPFTLIDQENGGQGSARNAGVAASRSDFICFLDQDDFYLPNHIEILGRAIPAGDARFGFVYGDLYEADVDGNVVRTQLVKEHSKDHPKKSIFDLLRWDMFVLPSATLVSRTAFDAVQGFDAQFMGFEDDDLFLRIFRKGYSNHYVDRAVTVWCIHVDSTSFGIRMIRSRYRFFKKLAATFPDEPRRGRFYLRDYLMPRFGKLFVDHAIEAIKLDNEYRAEMFEHLDDYAHMVLTNPYVGARAKFKLRLTRWLLAHSSPGTVRRIGAITKFPLFSAFRRLYRT